MLFAQAKSGSKQRLRQAHFSSCGAVMAANGAANGGSGGRAVLWFRNDLRLHDNAIVAEAARRAKSGEIAEVHSCININGPPNLQASVCSVARCTELYEVRECGCTLVAGGAGLLL
jgi:DNA photolyase